MKPEFKSDKGIESRGPNIEIISVDDSSDELK
jgi:hypothetical protein